LAHHDVAKAFFGVLQEVFAEHEGDGFEPRSASTAASLAIDDLGRTLLWWHERVPGDGGSDVGRYQLWRYETAVWRDLQFPVTNAAAYLGVGGGGDVATGDAGEVFVAAPWPDPDELRHHLRVYRSNGVP